MLITRIGIEDESRSKMITELKSLNTKIVGNESTDELINILNQSIKRMKNGK